MRFSSTHFLPLFLTFISRVFVPTSSLLLLNTLLLLPSLNGGERKLLGERRVLLSFRFSLLLSAGVPPHKSASINDLVLMLPQNVWDHLYSRYLCHPDTTLLLCVCVCITGVCNGCHGD